MIWVRKREATRTHGAHAKAFDDGYGDDVQSEGHEQTVLRQSRRAFVLVVLMEDNPNSDGRDVSPYYQRTSNSDIGFGVSAEGAL